MTRGALMLTGGRLSVMWTLAAREAILLIRHPAFLSGVVLSIVFHLAVPMGARDIETYGIVSGQGLLFLSGTTLIAAHLNVHRSYRHGDDLDRSVPMSGRDRVLAHLLAVLVAPVVGLLLLVPVWIATLGSAWVMEIDGVRWSPGLSQLAQGPMLVLVMGMLGVALGRVLSLAAVGPIAALVLVMSPLTWVNPLIVLDPAISDPTRDFVGRAGWHLLFLAGVGVTAGGISFGRLESTVRVAVPVVVGATAMATGFLLR